MGYVKKHSSKWDDTIIQPAVKTVERIVEDPKALAMVALTVFAPGVGTAIGGALGLGSGVAATVVGNTIVNTALNGGDVEKALIGAVLPVAGAEIANVAAKTFVDIGLSEGIAKAVGNATSRAALASATGADAEDAFLGSVIGSGVNAATNSSDFFKELPKPIQQAATAGITAGLTGGDAGAAASKSLVNAGVKSLFNNDSSVFPSPPSEDMAGTPVNVKDSIKVEGLPALVEAQNINPEDYSNVPDYIGGAPLVDSDKTQSTETVDKNLDLSKLVPTDVVQAPVGNNQDPSLYPVQNFGVPADQNMDSYQQTLQEIWDNGGTTSQWIPNDDGTKTMINDDGSTVSINENNNIVDNSSSPADPEFNYDPNMYPVQNFGVPADQNMDSYQKTLKEIWDNGGTTSQWQSNEDGTKTMVHDDGSTVTIDENNNIVFVTPSTDTKYEGTETPATKPVTPTPTPTPTPTITTPSPTTPGTKPTINPNIVGAAAAGLLASGLSSMVGGNKNETPEQPAAPQRNLKMDWNQQAIQAPQDGIAYGQQYLNPTFTQVQAAQGGLMSLAGGGMLGSYSDGGRLLRGPGDGMSDNIPASISNKQPARLADGEFVVPADVVSHLGNGSTEAGSRVLYEMMNRVRKARTGNPKQGKQINATKFMPK